VHNSPHFMGSHKHKLQLKYDEVWSEHGGIRLENGFFSVPVPLKIRQSNEIPTRKRASYRRRYQMLDKLALDIGASCALHNAVRPDYSMPSA
jgi:uncharacterized protein